MKRGMMPAHPTFFLKKDVYKICGLYNETYKIAGDFEFMLRIFKKKELKIHYKKEIIVKMQTGGISTSGLKGALIKNKELKRACKENNIKTTWFNLNTRFFYKIREFVFFKNR
jgi:hypothetical protein